MKERYRIYSTYLKGKYGEKVYKLPISIPDTCPQSGRPPRHRRMRVLRFHRCRVRKPAGVGDDRRTDQNQ